MNSGSLPIEVPSSRIEALVRLLGDEDPKILAVAWENLERIGAPALPEVERAALEAEDPRVRAQSNRFLKEWSRREVFRRWVDLCRGPTLDLEDGVFLIAESEYPDCDMGKYRTQLDGYAQVLKGRIATARTTDEAVRRISALLFHEIGYRGNSKEYYNPENSYLNRVFDLKRGLPITLATVFLLTARRVGVAVEGVGMPQHFLLKYRGASHEVFIDVFKSGILLTAQDCARRLAEAQVEFHADHLRAVSDREILSRTLGNLLRVYHNAEDTRRSGRITAMLKLLQK